MTHVYTSNRQVLYRPAPVPFHRGNERRRHRAALHMTVALCILFSAAYFVLTAYELFSPFA